MFDITIGDVPLRTLLIAASAGGTVITAVVLLALWWVLRRSFGKSAGGGGGGKTNERRGRRRAIEGTADDDAQNSALIESLLLSGAPSKHAAKFKIESDCAVYASAKPEHSLHANTRCSVSLSQGSLRILLQPGESSKSANSSSSSSSSSSSDEDADTKTTTKAAPTSPTARPNATPSPPPENGTCVAKNGEKLVCIALESMHSYLDPSDRTVLHIVPRAPAGNKSGAHDDGPRTLCDVQYKVLNHVHTISWTRVQLRFHHNPREADRWYSLLSAAPCTDRWLNFVRKIPENGLTTFNVMLARVLIENSSGPMLDDLITRKLRRELTSVELPSPLKGTTKLVSVRSGDEAPLFTNAKLCGVSATGEVEVDFDLQYNGGFQLAVDVDMAIGFVKVPGMRLNFTIGQIQGRVHMSVGIPPSNKMWIGFHEQPKLTLELHQDVRLPSDILASAISRVDISKTVTDLVHDKLLQDMILPSMDDFALPDFAPTPPGTPRKMDETAQQTSTEFPPSCCEGSGTQPD